MYPEIIFEYIITIFHNFKNSPSNSPKPITNKFINQGFLTYL